MQLKILRLSSMCNFRMALICYGADEGEIKNVKTTLICCEAMLGLKINFFKSELIGIKV